MNDCTKKNYWDGYNEGYLDAMIKMHKEIKETLNQYKADKERIEKNYAFKEREIIDGLAKKMLNENKKAENDEKKN